MKEYRRKTRFGKVTDLPFVFGILTKDKIAEIRRQHPNQPEAMSCRKEFIKGRGGSTKDPTWNRASHLHTCCQSKCPWRHKAACKRVLKDGDDFSDLKDPDAQT
jgi:hypothetical protein